MLLQLLLLSYVEFLFFDKREWKTFQLATTWIWKSLYNNCIHETWTISSQCWMKQCENTCAPVSRFFVFNWNYMKNSVHWNRKSTLFCCCLLLRRSNRIGFEVNISYFVRNEWKIAIISVILFTVLPTEKKCIQE